MKIKALRTFFIPGEKGCTEGEEYHVSKTFGQLAVKRGLAEEVKAAKVEEKEDPKKKKESKKK